MAKLAAAVAGGAAVAVGTETGVNVGGGTGTGSSVGGDGAGRVDGRGGAGAGGVGCFSDEVCCAGGSSRDRGWGSAMPKAAKRSASTCDMSAILGKLRGPSRSAGTECLRWGGFSDRGGQSEEMEPGQTRGATARSIVGFARSIVSTGRTIAPVWAHGGNVWSMGRRVVVEAVEAVEAGRGRDALEKFSITPSPHNLPLSSRLGSNYACGCVIFLRNTSLVRKVLYQP